MELIKKKVRMLKRKCEAVSQITFDEDLNVPDVKPDIGRMIQKRVIFKLRIFRFQREEHILPALWRSAFCMSVTARNGKYKVLWGLCA